LTTQHKYNSNSVSDPIGQFMCVRNHSKMTNGAPRSFQISSDHPVQLTHRVAFYFLYSIISVAPQCLSFM